MSVFDGEVARPALLIRGLLDWAKQPPNSLSAMPRASRSIKRAASLFYNALSAWLTADCDRPRSRAAPENGPLSTVRTKVAGAPYRSNMLISLPNGCYHSDPDIVVTF